MEIKSLKDVEQIGLLDELRADFARDAVNLANLQEWFDERLEGCQVDLRILNLLGDAKRRVRRRMRGKEV